MRIRRFVKHNYAVAGVIEALLLIALVAVIISLIQLYYVPDIMEEKEASHMDEVANQFSTIKSIIEMQSTMGIVNEESFNPKYTAYTSISSPITLGSEQLSYFVTAAATGQVTLIDEYDAGEYVINIQPAPVYFPSGIPLTSIMYEANNHYFLNQKYILEAGGIILNQSNGEVMRVNPAMNVVNYTNEIEITYDIPLFKGVAGKKLCSGGGYGPPKICYVRTNYTKYYESQGNINFIHIYTSHPEAWGNGFIDSTKGLLWEYYDNGYINVNIDKSTTPNRIVITPGTKDIYLKLTIIEIGVQVGAGVVISN